MATEAARLECKESTRRKEKTLLTHSGLLMEGVTNLFTGRVPVVSAKTTLSGFRRFRQSTASGALIKDNLVLVLVKNRFSQADVF
jgi:hypothetical protein